MKRTLISTTLITSLIASVFCHAQPPQILPGLWEHKTNMQSKGGHLEAAMEQARTMLENLPAEQRKMIEEMMKKQGIDPDAFSRTTQICLTQSQIDNFKLPKADDRCAQTFEQKSDNIYKMTLKCPGNPETKGEGEFTIENNKTYTGNIMMEVHINGEADIMTMEQKGRWLSSDCRQ